MENSFKPLFVNLLSPMITFNFHIVKNLKISFVKEIFKSVFNTLSITLTAQNCNKKGVK